MQFKWSQHPYVIEEDLGKGALGKKILLLATYSKKQRILVGSRSTIKKNLLSNTDLQGATMTHRMSFTSRYNAIYFIHNMTACTYLLHASKRNS